MAILLHIDLLHIEVFKYINEKIQVKAGEIENGHIFEQ